jgi:hypothetical protein
MERKSQALRTPRAAGLVGIIFALLLAAAIILIRLAIPERPGNAGDVWLTDPSRRRTVQTALRLIPFAGIFFLWSMGAVRARIGKAEDQFFATVFLGSGLVFVATLFGAAAAAGSLLATADPYGTRRLGNPRLVEDPPPYRQNAVLRGPRHLTIAFDGLRA